MTTTDEAETTVRPFTAILQEIDKGRVNGEASEQLHDLIAAVTQTGKGGKLVITVAIKPPGKNSPEGVLAVTSTVTASIPRTERRDSLFYLSPDGNLVRDNPQQPDLPFQVHEGGASVTTETGPQAVNGS